VLNPQPTIIARIVRRASYCSHSTYLTNQSPNKENPLQFKKGSYPAFKAEVLIFVEKALDLAHPFFNIVVIFIFQALQL